MACSTHFGIQLLWNRYNSWAAALERQLQSKLELTWIEGCRRLSCIGPKHVHVGYVELVDQVKHVHRAIQLEALCQVKGAADAEIGEHRRRLDARVTLQIANQRAVHPAGG